jgi:proton-dependent oligopeptide transporter, POT family
MFVTNRTGFYIGLGLIALGSGGIKPCVAAFVGDQFDQTNKHRAKEVFDAFYWIINFGSFFASLLMPLFLRHIGPAFAFGIPGVLMFISTAILWLGRKQYVMVPPAPPNPHSFLRVSRSAIISGLRGQLLAAVAVAVAIGSFALMPKFGFVVAACLALVALISFGGLGVWLQLDSVRDNILQRQSKASVQSCGCSCCLRSSHHSGRCSTRKRRHGCCRRMQWQSRAGFSPRKCRH